MNSLCLTISWFPRSSLEDFSLSPKLVHKARSCSKERWEGLELSYGHGSGRWVRESVLEVVAGQPHSDGTLFFSLFIVVLYVVCSWIYRSYLHM